MHKILVVGGIKGYSRYREQCIQIMQQLNSEINNDNTTFISLQPQQPWSEEADWYIGQGMHGYSIVNDVLMNQFGLNMMNHIPHYEKDVIDFNNGLDGTLDFIIWEHCGFGNSVEILKYHNMLKMGGYLIDFAEWRFPNGNITFVPPKCEYMDPLDGGLSNVRHVIKPRNMATLFAHVHPHVFQKTRNVQFNIEEHTIRYEKHLVDYLLSCNE